MSGWRERWRWVREAEAEQRWLTRMQGGLAWQAYCVEQEAEFDASRGVRGARPNRIGCWLLVLAGEARWYWRLAWYLATGRKPEWME